MLIVEEKAYDLANISHLIRNRRSIYADEYSTQKVARELIKEIVTNAIWAPTYKMTQPWRFEVLEGKHHKKLGDYMATFYREKYGEVLFSKTRYEETRTYPLNATLVAVIFQRNEKSQLSEWEEVAATSCAVQNMWLSCSAIGLGAYWDTAEATLNYCKANITLAENEKSFGIFYMGYPKKQTKELPRKRKSIHKKLKWNRN